MGISISPSRECPLSHGFMSSQANAFPLLSTQHYEKHRSNKSCITQYKHAYVLFSPSLPTQMRSFHTALQKSCDRHARLYSPPKQNSAHNRHARFLSQLTKMRSFHTALQKSCDGCTHPPQKFRSQ